jgi:hypothetical protein
MELGDYSEDGLDQLLVRAEAEIGSWRAVQMAVVAQASSHVASSGWFPVDCGLDRGSG